MAHTHLRTHLLVTFTLFAGAARSDALGGSASFDIPSQPVGAALIEFSQQADVQVMGSSSAFGSLKSTAVKGKLRSADALRALLRNTGLEYETARHAIVVRPIVNPRIVADATSIAREPVVAETISAARRLSLLVPLGEMTVTGTHIRGGELIGSQLIVMDRASLDRSGYATVQDVIRSLPQNFGGGPSEDTTDSEGNAVRGTGINLRGLGAGSTLVLLNGRRLTLGGARASFVDISGIPLAAVARIEILPDGASAIYGSDAVGGVVNIILRNDFEGAETQGRYGSVTQGSLQETDISQLWGTRWNSGHATLSYEYYRRDALPARSRALTADSDLRRLGGGNFSSREASPGTISIAGRSYAIPGGQAGTALTPDSFVPDMINWQNLNQDRDLYGDWHRHSGFFTVSQALGDSITVSGDSLFSSREVRARNPGASDLFLVPASNPFRVLPAGAPATAPYVVQYNLGKDLGIRTFAASVDTLAASLEMRLVTDRSWEVNGSVAYGDEDVRQVQDNNYNSAAAAAALADPNRATSLNLFGTGGSNSPATLDRIRRSTLFTSDSTVRSVNLITNGDLLSLPGGELRLALGGDYREQFFQSHSRSRDASVDTASPHLERIVSAAFGEMLVPAVSSSNRVPGVELLQLSLAARYDKYSDFGSTFNPRIGVEWSPMAHVTVHGGWGKAFRAPNLPDLDERQAMSYIVTVPDPQAPGGVAPVLAWLGGNRELKPESATTWTAGIKWSPDLRFAPALDLSYFDTHFNNRIQAPPSVDTYLLDPQWFSSIITRDPSAALRADICSRGTYIGNFSDTAGDCSSAPIAAVIDGRLNNTLETDTRGLDLLVTMDADTEWGRFAFSGNVSYVLEFSEAHAPTMAMTGLLDTVGNPLRFKTRDSVSWSNDAFGASVAVNYAGSYADKFSVPGRRVGSWTTFDLNLSYAVDPAAANWLAGCTLMVNAQNLFDTDPPFVNNSAGVGYDRENADLLKRFVSVRLQKRW